MTFRIGQRVRIVRCTNHPEFAGVCGIIGTDLHPHYASGEMVHRIDGTGIPVLPGKPGWFAAPWQLEPIQPSGHQVTTWAEMANTWLPEHLRGEVMK